MSTAVFHGYCPTGMNLVRVATLATADTPAPQAAQRAPTRPLVTKAPQAGPSVVTPPHSVSLQQCGPASSPPPPPPHPGSATW